jgi:hypothetical protein
MSIPYVPRQAPADEAVQHEGSHRPVSGHVNGELAMALAIVGIGRWGASGAGPAANTDDEETDVPNLTRRSVLMLGLGTVGAGFIGRPGAALATATSPRGSDGLPLRSQFLPGVGAVFSASAATGRHRLRLVEILDVPPSPVARDEHAFNLIFEQISATPMTQGIYRLTCSRVPATSLFLSPIGLSTKRQEFQALVNRQR